MTTALDKQPDLPAGQKHVPAVRAGAILLGALFLTWPAIYNGFPILYPDSLTYIADGPPVARALFLHQFSAYYGIRSFIYSLGILPFYRYGTLWSIILLQAGLTAYVLWLVVRSAAPQQAREHLVARYLAIVAFLSLLTSGSWFASLIMPDILGPLLYLGIYLLVFARDKISRGETIAVGAIAWWGIASHATHLMLAAALCALFMVLWAIFRNGFLRWRLRAIGEVAMLIVLAAAAQLALHNYLYGEPSLNGDRPPFLLVRLIDDGPARWYLEQHCGEAKFAMCDHLDELNQSPDEFLWSEDGTWQLASREEKKKILQQEIPLALAVVRAYPRAQMLRSARNFEKQLYTFSLGFEPNEWVVEEMDRTMPGQKEHYMNGRQMQRGLHLELFSAVEYGTVIISALVIAAFFARSWRAVMPRLAWLAFVILAAVIANAFITGTLSMVENRYQSRVVWLLPLLAALLVLDSRMRTKTNENQHVDVEAQESVVS